MMNQPSSPANSIVAANGCMLNNTAQHEHSLSQSCPPWVVPTQSCGTLVLASIVQAVRLSHTYCDFVSKFRRMLYHSGSKVTVVVVGDPLATSSVTVAVTVTPPHVAPVRPAHRASVAHPDEK